MLVSATLISSLAAQCVNQAVLGHCLYTGCFMGHGAAHCHGFQCRCDANFCSSNGHACVHAVTTTTRKTTTTDIFHNYDPCGVQPYLESGEGPGAVASCVAQKCRSWFSIWQTSEKFRCCSLQCTAEVTRAGLSHCWEQVAPQFFQQAISEFGMKGRKHNRKQNCPISGMGPDSNPLTTQPPEIVLATSDEDPADEIHYFVAVACAGIMVGMVIIVFNLRERYVEQPPLLA